MPPRHLLSTIASPNRMRGIVTAAMASPMRQARRSHNNSQQSGSQGVISDGRPENPMAVSRVRNLYRLA